MPHTPPAPSALTANSVPADSSPLVPAAAIWLTLRADLRRRRRPLLALALLLGLLGGVVLTAAAGARRTDTAYPRMLAWANSSQLDILPQGIRLNGYYRALATLPQVESMGTGQLGQATLPADRATSVQLIWSPDGTYGTRVDRPRILAGHLFDESVAGQAMINQAMAAAEHLRPGDKVRVLGVPNNPVTSTPDFSRARTLTFLVTAIVALDPQMDIQAGGYGTPAVLVSSPFAAAPFAGSLSYGVEAVIRLRPGASMTGFTAAATALADRYADTPGHPNTGVHVDVINSADQVTALEEAARPQAVALAAFAALTALITLVVLGQLLARQLALESAEFPVLRAFGATRATLVTLSLARLAVITVTGALLAVAIAVTASPLMPIGPARAVELSPGFEVNLAVLGAGAAAIVLLPLAVLSPAAWRAAGRAAGPLGAAEPGPRRGRPSRFATLASGTGSVPGSVGVRMAFESGRGRTAVPVRSALAGSVIAVAAVVAAAVFGASLAGLLGTPRAYGQNWDAITDLGFGGVSPQTAARLLAAAPAIAADAPGDYDDVIIAGTSIAAIGLDHGDGYVTLLAGRGPRDDGEIALGARTLHDLGLRLGQTVTVTVNHNDSPTPDKTATMRIVGEVVLPRFARGTFAPTGLGTGAVVTASVLSEPASAGGCAGPLCYNFFLLRYRPGTDTATRDTGLTKALRAFGCPVTSCLTTADQRPAEIRNYASVRDVPLVLGAVLAVLAVATLTHVLLTSVRHRRRDLAVLKTLGLTPGQVLRLVAWQASALAAAALLAGLPLGVIAGRGAWAFFANAVGVAPQPDVPLPLVLLTIPVTLMLANLIATGPGRAAARLRPAAVLHAE